MTVLVSDSFNRANSTTTLGTTDSYNGGTNTAWTAVNGTWGIQNNQAYWVGGTDAVAVVNAGASDVSVSVTFVTASSNPRMVWRCTDNSNLFLIQGNAIFRKQAGSYTQIGTASSTIAAGNVVKVTVSGSTHTVYINGTQVWTGTDSFNSTATQHGIGNQGSANNWDNFEVDSLTTGTNTAISSTVKSTTSSTSNLVGGTHTMAANTVKSNTTSLASVMLDRMAESSTVSSTSSMTGAVSVSRTLGSTVTGHSNQTSTLTVTGTTPVPISSTVKSNSSSSLASQVSRLLITTVKSNSTQTGGLRNSIQTGSTVKSNSSTQVNITIVSPHMTTALSGGYRSNFFVKVAPVFVNRKLSSSEKSKTKASATLLNLLVVSILIETIKFKRGNKANLPSLNQGEPAFTLDTDELFVGSSGGNIKIVGMLVESSLSNLPTPSANNQWMIAGVTGSAGVADALYVCKMLSNGTYDWVQFA